MNAMRYALPPLPQPNYSFRDIPRCSGRDLKGSTVQYVSDREDFQRCMAEMLLVCKEAARRRRTRFPELAKDDGSKPLSLEYLADRLDVDEPLWGYLVRNEGRLTGFVCVTTFTNYEKSFRWDSCNEAAFSGDDDEEQKMRASGARKIDTSGEMARKLQSTVRCGDVWQEGIVWPRIAEISLLGGLGCGRTLVELVLEDLERMKASKEANYDHVVLQATDNSISFYESLGFVRVGAITKRDDKEEENNKRVDETSRQAKGVLYVPENVVMSKVIPYEVKKAGEQLTAIAKKFKADVNDILFLNQNIYSDLSPSSRLIKGTVLRIPAAEENLETDPNNSSSAREIQWHTAKENDTPRTISKMYKVSCDQLVRANRNRLKGLMSNSRLRQGTQVRVSHLDAIDVQHGYVPYAHWAFPDDDHFEAGEPSYMMAKMLARRKGAAANSRPVRERLAANIENYQPTDMVINIPPNSLGEGQSLRNMSNGRQSNENLPSGFDLFVADFKKRNPNLFQTTTEAKQTKILAEAWETVLTEDKVLLIKESARKRLECSYSLEQSIKNQTNSEPKARITLGQVNSQENLYNMVVRVQHGETDTVDVDVKEYQYWYVLTFIPDLRWCHLAPMIQDGVFGPDKARAAGRPKWKLVNANLGKELDISSAFCVPIKSRALKKTTDADKEEWDIIDDDKQALNRHPTPSRETTKRKPSSGSSVASKRQALSVSSDMSKTQAPSVSSDASCLSQHSIISALEAQTKCDNSPALIATLAGDGKDVRVKITGISLNLGTSKKKSSGPSVPRKRKHSGSAAGKSALVAILPGSDGKEVRVNITGTSAAQRAPRTNQIQKSLPLKSQLQKNSKENNLVKRMLSCKASRPVRCESSSVLSRLDSKKAMTFSSGDSLQQTNVVGAMSCCY